jgi:XTP/dITP diphosphohydrolase
LIDKLVIASSNPGKLREIGALLDSLGIEVLPQSAFQIPKVAEPHSTFVENALAKARHAASRTGWPALADDSGICVDALGGAPVLSARFAGEPRSDERNNQRLLEVLQPHSNRKAHYYCVMVLMTHGEDPEPLIAEGHWYGEILRAPRGTGGFGYDPLFLDPRLDKTGAELSPPHKNRISHRGKALAALRRSLNLRG